MSEVFLAGVSMTRFGPHPDRSVKDLTREAVAAALEDAGADLREVGIAFFGSVTQGPLEGQVSVPGEMALRAMGFGRIPMVNVENACATGSTALHLAAAYLRAGMADVALAVGVEKMVIENRSKVMALFDGGMDIHDLEATYNNLLALGEGIEAPEVQGPRTAFMDLYAAFARAHMKTYGTTQRQLAVVAAKNHAHSVLNPKCHYQKDMSVEEVLAGRPLGYPLTVPMCSPLSDGASAAILCTRPGLTRLRGTRPVKVYASVLATGTDRAPQAWDRHITRLAAQQAYDLAGVGPGDMSLAEVHDASAMGEILQTENLGFCAMGEGGPLAESGATRLGGRIPVNPSGGLESKGHPLAATGLAQVFELVTQLRGEAGARQVPEPRFAIAENGGGLYGYEEACACVTILGPAR
jgi:acetyl-CoA acetyltransferase